VDLCLAQLRLDTGDSPLGLILFLAIAVLGIVASIIAAAQAAKRRERLAQIASSLGLTFDQRHDPYHDDEYAHFEIFRRGFDRVAYNTLKGQLAFAGLTWPAKMGDFRYKTEHRDSKGRRHVSVHTFSYLILHTPWPHLPDLLVRREGVFDKIATVFGSHDIDFESAEFSRKFHVWSPDRRFAYDVFHPRMIEFMLATTPPAFDFERGRCCVSDGSRTWNAGDFAATVRWLDEFFSRWPEYLVKDLSAAHAGTPAHGDRQ
jgi:hypothetical protein